MCASNNGHFAFNDWTAGAKERTKKLSNKNPGILYLEGKSGQVEYTRDPK